MSGATEQELQDFAAILEQAYADVAKFLVLQRTFIPVACITLPGACDGRHKPHGSAVASTPRVQAPPVCQRSAWGGQQARASALVG
jgi:starvation-inducible outer membrane lipoprotein